MRGENFDNEVLQKVAKKVCPPIRSHMHMKDRVLIEQNSSTLNSTKLP
jgi:hypothetical protein